MELALWSCEFPCESGTKYIALSENVVISVGGDASFPYLRIQCFIGPKFEPKRMFVNSGGYLNRYNHSLCVVNKEIYVIGGTKYSSGLPTDEILKITMCEDSCNVSLVGNNELVLLSGHGCVSIGANHEKALIWGGSERDPVIFDPHGENMFTSIAISGGSPSSRCQFGFLSSGEHNNLVFVYGGKNMTDGTVLNDVWLLDISEYLGLPRSVAVANEKGKKPSGKNAPTGPSSSWFKLCDFSPRYSHCFFAICDAHVVNLFSFGGMSSVEMLPIKLFHTTYSIGKDACDSFSEYSSICLSSNGNEESFYQSNCICGASVCYLLNNGYFVFGGLSNNGNKSRALFSISSVPQ